MWRAGGRLGVDVVHTATSTLANGASHPATEQFIHNVGRHVFDRIDLSRSSRSRNGYATSPSEKEAGRAIVEHDAFHYEHQMPGGMISNLKSQLATLGICDKLPQFLRKRRACVAIWAIRLLSARSRNSS